MSNDRSRRSGKAREPQLTNRPNHYYNPRSQFATSNNYDDYYDSFEGMNSRTGGQPNPANYVNPSSPSPPGMPPMGPSNSGFNQNNDNGMSSYLATNVAMQYGHSLVGQGKKIIDKEVEKYVSTWKLKYYFAVDSSYVCKKLSLLFFPFRPVSSFTLKYDPKDPAPPIFDVNAPDLYIPTMAFLTYILIAGLSMGTNNKFSPEKLSIQASSALAWTVFEILIQLLALYLGNINTHLKTLDLIAYSTYKYVKIVVCILVGLIFGHIPYYAVLFYVCMASIHFTKRVLQIQVMTEPDNQQNANVYGNGTFNYPANNEMRDLYGSRPPYSDYGLTRKRYFTFYVTLTQPLIIWWFSWQLI